jgi:hypothetical protein
MVMMFKLATRQVDFNTAFAQATLKEDVYLEMPCGYESAAEDMVLSWTKVFTAWSKHRRCSMTTCAPGSKLKVSESA